MSKADAKAVVDLVGKDSESKKRISSVIDNILPDSWGISGAMRNWGYVLGGMATLGNWGDPSEKEFADRVCTGIADATSLAINKLIKAGDPRMRKFTKAVTVDRTLRSTAHTATGIVMADGSEHVIDWHATLSAENPMLFESVRDWKADKNGITYEEFSGW
jgi:hypothetical protein